MLLETDRWLNAFDILDQGEPRDPLEEMFPDLVQPADIDPTDEDLSFWDDRPDDDDPFWLGGEVETDIGDVKTAAREKVSGAPAPTLSAGSQRAMGENFNASRWMSQYDNGRIPSNALALIPGGGQLRADAAQAWKAMVRAAKREDGVTIGAPTDTYRSYAAQVATAADKGLYSKGGLAADPGTSDHGWGIAVDTAEQGREWIAKNGSRFGWVEDTPREPWHFGYKGWDGATVNANARETSARRSKRPKDRRPKSRNAPKQSAKADIALGGSFLTQGQSDLTGGLAVPAAFTMLEKDRRREQATQLGVKGKGVWAQLKRGFLSVGREDLAHFVDNKDFRLWVMQESGGNPRNVSPANNNGVNNGGLFQFWYGHDWAQKYFKNGGGSSYAQGNRFQMSVFDQAVAAVEHFGLSVNEIKGYADAIRSGSYVGWG